jgi:adenosylcobinamide-phosphate synthase
LNSYVLHIWIALALDFLIGDPRWMPHPVRLIGRTAQILESPARRILSNQRLAGIVVATIIIGGSVLATWGLLKATRGISSLLGDLFAIWMLYSSLAVKDLAVHSRFVLRALESGDLVQARQAVGRMVGRDTAQLSEPGIIRGTVESVAENTVDSVVSPLFFAFLFGPVGAMAFKAINTLDSTFGYRNDRYIHFGWASARIDDVANFVPARLGLLFVSIGAFLSIGRPGRALRIGLRDARKHKSPNAGFPEAAFAGALGIQLGGPLSRNGCPEATPFLGDPIAPLDQCHIYKANTLMFAATLAAALLMSGWRVVFLLSIQA